MSKPDFLESSLKQLADITRQTHNEKIVPIALDIWGKHLRPENPVWNFLQSEPFSVDDSRGSAHVIAMIDRRLPELGLLGFFGCTSAEGGVEVLERATTWLKGQGITAAYGPINGTITRDYRFNLDDDYVIPGEPVNPIWYVDVFKQAGFEIYNRYVSGRAKHYKPFIKLFVRKPGKEFSYLAVRPFNADHQLDDLKIYHELMNAIFPSNSIYCPVLSWEERVYNVVSDDLIFNPDYSYFLEDNGKPIGFIVAYPHNAELIIKTIGILPEYRGKHVSGLLIHKVHDKAAEDGLKAAVYSTVRVGNQIYKMKRPGVKVYRRYVTMRKQT